MNFLKFIKDHKIDILIVLGLFLLSFGIRAIPADKFEGIYGFDSFWAARQTKYIITGEHSFPYQDMNTDYPYGRLATLIDPGWWYPNAWAYNIAALFTGTEGFNYDLFGQTFSWAVVFAGALLAPIFYLLGKEMFSKKMGLLAGLFISVSQNHIFYSLFGHAENDALGLSLMFLTLLFFVLTLKKKNYWYLGATAISFTWLTLTWLSFKAVLALVAGTIITYYVITFILKKLNYFNEDDSELKKWMFYSFASLLAAIPLTYLLVGWVKQSIIPIIALTLLGITVIGYFDKKPKITFPKSIQGFFKSDLVIQTGSVAIVLTVIGFAVYGSAMINTFATFGQYTAAEGGMEERPDYELRMLTTIAEQGKINNMISNNYGINQQTGQLNVNHSDVTITMKLDFLSKQGFSIFIWFAALGALISILKVLINPFLKKEVNIYNIMTAGFLCYGILFLTDRLQPFFFLSSVVMFGSAYFFNSLINMADYLKKIVKDNIKYVKVSIMCIALVISFSHLIFSSQNISSFGYDITPSWRDAINVINSPAIPNGAVIAAWWDYGHWMNYFNGDKIKVNLDNIQDRPEIIYTVAKAFTHVPGDNCMLGASDMHCPIDEQSLEKAEIEALSYLKPLRSTHILIDSEIMGGIVGGKGQALKVIAGKVPGTGKDIGCMQLVPGCQKNQNGDVTCPIGEESLSFSAIEWQMMKKESWPGKILQSEQVGTRMFVKDDINGAPILHMSALSCGNFYPSAQSPIIYAFMERLFFNDQSLKHVELIHDNGAIVIYKINWEGIPDPEELGLENVLPPLES